MTKPKKPEPNLIEEAIGDRTKPKTSEIPDEPTPSEMLTLEELNRQTEKRLQDDSILDEKLTPEEHRILNQAKPTIPVSKPDLQPVAKTSSPASPPQGTDEKPWDKIGADTKFAGAVAEDILDNTYRSPQKVRDVRICPDCGIFVKDLISDNLLCSQHKIATEKEILKTCSNKETSRTFPPQALEHTNKQPAEDVELTALKKYILEDGFNEAAVAFHIVTLCSQPLVTTSTTTWAYQDRAKIPEMVLALLYKPGYIEGLWPSLRIVMSDNKGNSAWTSGIAMTIAFFDVIRMLPILKEMKELQNDS